MKKESNEEKLLKSLTGMIESYDIAMGVLKESMASGVVRGAFITEIDKARKLTKVLKESK